MPRVADNNGVKNGSVSLIDVIGDANLGNVTLGVGVNRLTFDGLSASSRHRKGSRKCTGSIRTSTSCAPRETAA